MQNYFRILISIISAIIVFFVSHKIQIYCNKGNKNLNYICKTRKTYYIKLIIYILFIGAALCGILFLQLYENYFIYFFIAFGTKALYQLVLCILARISNRKMSKKTLSNKESEDFVYCDNILMLNLIGVIIVATIYFVMNNLNLGYPYIELIGNMLSIMASFTFFTDSYYLYAEFAKKDDKTLFYQIDQKEWNVPDKIYLKIHCIEHYIRDMFKQKETRFIHVLFVLIPIITLILNN